MPTEVDQMEDFIAKKNAESPFLSLLDGESVRVKYLKSRKMITKVGFGGDEVECMRYVCLVETEYGDKEKNFDNSSNRFAKECREKGVQIGSSFVITRDGEGPKTRYNVTEVVTPKTPTAEEVKTATEILGGEEVAAA